MPSINSPAPVSPPPADPPPGRAAAPPLALYIHWPFCRAKCPYCDFNSHVAADIDAGRWRRALLAELDYLAALVPRRRLISIFFGGGTPSLMPPEITAALIERAKSHWPAADDLEITLEANPTSSEARRFAAYAAAGVNRLSLGVQALDDEALRFLGREHDGDQALTALAAARAVFPRLSVDLIYARPGQTLAAWLEELERLLPHLGDHVSLYQLTIEKGTPFYARHRAGEIPLPDPSLAADLHMATGDRLAEAGYGEYEISNYARPGTESRHNLVYWRYGEYGGVGPGAHGRLKIDAAPRTALADIAGPRAWLNAVEQRGHGLVRREPLGFETARAECLMMGLRLTEGIGLDAYRDLFGEELPETLPADALAALAGNGDLVLEGRSLRATRQGRLRLDAVLARLLT